jgi:hypothetical protein
MNNRPLTLVSGDIGQKILTIRGKRVILDANLAALYGTATKRLNQAVKRNRGRFPDDFMFRLNPGETKELVRNCDRLNYLKHLADPPHAFTKHVTIQAANLLKSQLAIAMSVLVVRAFVQMRELMLTHQEIMRRIDSLESHYDQQFRIVFDAIRELMIPPTPPQRRIGF